jgi:predicted HicB family RNase H-like nuclease
MGYQTMNNTMTYKGYTAKIEYDDRDEIFYGRVLGTQSAIDFEGKSVAELKKDFKAGIDDYLKYCEEKGLEPEKQLSGKFIVRIPPDLHQKAVVKAEAEGISLNQLAVEAIAACLAFPGKGKNGAKHRPIRHASGAA